MRKLADKRFEKIGFIKTEENDLFVRYERKNNKYNYTQRLDFLHKASGNHLVQSYDADTGTQDCCVGLTDYELKCCRRKFRELKW